MTTLLNSFEGGTNTTTISTVNSGGASGTAFDVVSIGASAVAAFSNTHAAHGNLSGNFSTGASSVASYLEWSTSMGSQSQVWFRLYAYFTGAPAATISLFRAYQSTTQVGGLDLISTGKLQMTDASNAAIFTTTATIPLNQWFRMEGLIVGSATLGQAILSLYTNPDGPLPAETDTSTANQNTFGAPDNYRFGITNAVTNAASFWLDDLGLSSEHSLGPAVLPLLPPASSIVMRTVTIPASSTVPVFTVPSGLNNVVIFQPSQAQAIYIGTSAKVSTANGMQVPVTPLTSEIYIGSSGATYYATTGNATASTFSYLISSAK